MSQPHQPLITVELAREAVACVRPLFEQSVATTRFGESGAAHVVILTPGVPETAGADSPVLYEESFGTPATWDADYAGFARAKARLAWRARRDSGSVQALAPHLLQGGDTLLGGGVYVDGMAVGVSGMHAWFDEALAASVAWFLRALARREVAARHGKLYLE